MCIHRIKRVPSCKTIASALVGGLMLIVAATGFADEGSVTDTAIAAADRATPYDADSIAATADANSGAGSKGEVLYPMSPERQAKLISYSKFRNIWRFVSFGIGIGILLLILGTGWSARLRDVARRIRPRFFAVWVFMVLIILVDYFLGLPFSIYRGFVVESNYGFMNQNFLQWWGEDLLGLSITMVIGIIPVWFFYWLVGKYKHWWLIFSIGAIPFAIVAVVVAPVVISPLFNDFEPLKDEKVKTEILALASKAGIEDADVFQVNASKQSSKINAYVTGLFGSKRIVLYDTMLDNFEVDEIKFVMAHEMGHYVKNHVWWGVLLSIVFIAFLLWLMNRLIPPVIRRFQDRFGFDKLSDMASLPLVMLTLSVMSFVFAPVSNSVSRYMEHQSDVYGMDMSGVTGEVAAVSFDKLSVFNLSDPDPPAIIEFWFYSHPSLKKRMEFVRGYRP